MDSLRNTYREESEEEDDFLTATITTTTTTTTTNTSFTTATNGGSEELPPPMDAATATDGTGSQNGIKEETFGSDAMSEEEASDDVEGQKTLEIEEGAENSKFMSRRISEEGEDEDPPPKKQKPLSSLDVEAPLVDHPLSGKSTPEEANGFHTTLATVATSAVKKAKKKNNNVWTKPTSRKGKKKIKTNNNNNNNAQAEDAVFITPAPRFPDKNDDKPDMKICLSKVYKAERVELSEDRMCAGSTKGYRMVRATRGVEEGAWYFEIKVVKLGETGHTRLGWSTDKGDLQAPVGYDGNSFGYRDIDGCKIHRALREKYGDEEYVEGDVIGFYVNLPEGSLYAPKQPHLVLYKGQRYVCAPDGKEDPPKIVPGSEISFFKNGVCQGVAFKDLYGGRYYPAASMYTLPNQPNCTVKFNFGPNFEFFPEDFNGRPLPQPMIEVPYHGFDNRVENGASTEKKS